MKTVKLAIFGTVVVLIGLIFTQIAFIAAEQKKWAAIAEATQDCKRVTAAGANGKVSATPMTTVTSEADGGR